MQGRWVRALVAGGLAAGALAVVAPPARADAGPFTLTTLSIEAGYFRAQLTCPAKTTMLRFEWSPAPTGLGYGEIEVKKGPLDLNLRMQADAPGATISVTLKCISGFKKVRATFGPVDVTSGNSLLGVPDNSGNGRRIIYSMSAQQLWAVESDGSVGRTYLVSGRRLGILGAKTQLGTFAVYSTALLGCVNGIHCPHMVRFHRTPLNNIGFHAIPYSKAKGGFWEKPEELGQPRSGGCVRARPEDAEWLYNWVHLGDPVYVVV